MVFSTVFESSVEKMESFFIKYTANRIICISYLKKIKYGIEFLLTMQFILDMLYIGEDSWKFTERRNDRPRTPKIINTEGKNNLTHLITKGDVL